jgi:hypothetical protein
MKHLIALLLCVLGIVMPCSQQASAQDSTTIVHESPASFQVSKVTGLANLTAGNGSRLRVGDRIRLDVEDLESLIAQRKSDTTQLLLYVDGVPMTDIKAAYYDLIENSVFFDLKRGAGSDPWDIFYQSPLVWNKNIIVSIGYYNVGAIDGKIPCELVIIRRGYFWSAIFLILILCVLLVYVIKRGLLKDDSVLPLGDRSYSLSRSQLTFWTFIIAVSYIFIALVTGELAPLTTSTLVLLGISGVTTAVASTIDSNDKLNSNSRQQDNYPSDGFINDILSDKNGISVQRFQMLVFNLILGIFFVKEVFTTLQMPDFDSNLLTLLGLSNVTYAGLKVNENKGADIVNPQITDAAPAEEIPPVG